MQRRLFEDELANLERPRRTQRAALDRFNRTHELALVSFIAVGVDKFYRRLGRRHRRVHC